MTRSFVMSLAITAVLSTAAAAQDRPTVELSPDQREAVTRHITRGPATEGPAEGVAELRPGVEVPPTIRLYPVPREVAEDVPPVRGFRYFVAENQMALVDPQSHRIVEVVPVR